MPSTTEGTSRRDFMRGVGVTLAGIATAKSALAKTLQELSNPSEHWRFDDGYWAKVREHFVMPEGFAYMNTGRLGSTPKPVLDALLQYWRLMAENPSENSAIFEERQEDIRVSTAYYNTFEQVDRVLSGLRELASGAS